MEKIHLFVDYQNVHLSIAEAFAPPGTPHHTTLIHPGKFGDALMARRARFGRRGELYKISVFRGQPSSNREVEAAARNKAQSAEWSRDARVEVHNRVLRYPKQWPDQKAKEKGVDVALAIALVRCALSQECGTIVLASRDTDLVPALEMAVELGSSQVEVTHWQGTSRLRLPGTSMWCTTMTGADYLASKDPREY